MRNFQSQLRVLATGAMIAAAGGLVYVAAAGGTAKATIYSPDTGLAITNPMALVNGKFDFNVADTVTAVDLYIQSPTGHFVVVKNVKPSGDASIGVDTSRLTTTMVIPFNVANQAGDATETNTLFTVPGYVQPNVGVYITAIDATETIEVGTLSTDSGDADGYIDVVSVGTLGYAKATLTNGSATLGALLKVQDSANAGDAVPEQNVSMVGKAITYTLTTGSDTAAGFIVLPVALPVTSL